MPLIDDEVLILAMNGIKYVLLKFPAIEPHAPCKCKLLGQQGHMLDQQNQLFQPINRSQQLLGQLIYSLIGLFINVLVYLVLGGGLFGVLQDVLQFC